MKTNDYIIANRRVRLCGVVADVVERHISSFEPFRIADPSADEAVIEVAQGDVDINTDVAPLTSFDFDEGQAVCSFYLCGDSYMLTISGGELSVSFVCDKRVKRAQTNIPTVATAREVAFLRFGLWYVIGMALVLDGASAVHSSTIVCHDRAALFLGESGTGKSTHTRLWLENIAGAELLNDDSPFVFEDEMGIKVCGSPWSGKTPCYKNKSYPLAAVVRLSQAPHNKMWQLGKLQAIGALLPSLPPAFVYDKVLEDNLLQILSKVLQRVPVYHLECLPNADAALLSYKTIFGDGAKC